MNLNYVYLCRIWRLLVHKVARFIIKLYGYNIGNFSPETNTLSLLTKSYLMWNTLQVQELDALPQVFCKCNRSRNVASDKWNFWHEIMRALSADAAAPEQMRDMVCHLAGTISSMWKFHGEVS
jgi:hypothetical protein